jgi:hypothetical protein
MQNTFLNYRTYDQLLAEIQSDFKKYYLEDFINPQEFIKVAKRCNYELGLRIFKTKEIVLDIEKGRAKLPNNFQVLNFAFILADHYTVEPLISGTHVENVNLGPVYNPGNWNDVDLCSPATVPHQPENKPCDVPHPHSCGSCGSKFESCTCKPVGDVKLDCKGNFMVLTQHFKYHTRRWKTMHSLRIINSPDVVDADCPNKTWQSANTAYIKNGFIYPSFKTGKLYINYQSMMEDEDGNILVPDHDMLNEFYEYAIKQRVLENMIMNGEAVNGNQIQIIEQRLRAARNNAFSLVNTPNFSELRRIWEVNRKAQYHNFYNMFLSYR